MRRSPLQIARQHRQAERVLQDSGLQHTVLRPVFFMQNLLAMVRDGTIATAARRRPGRDDRCPGHRRGRRGRADHRAGRAAGSTRSPDPRRSRSSSVADVIGRQIGRAVRHVRRPGRGRVRAVARRRSRGVVRRGHGCAARHARRRVRGRRHLRPDLPDRCGGHPVRPIRRTTSAPASPSTRPVRRGHGDSGSSAGPASAGRRLARARHAGLRRCRGCCAAAGRPCAGRRRLRPSARCPRHPSRPSEETER